MDALSIYKSKESIQETCRLEEWTQMMRTASDLDYQAEEAARKRAVYYGTAGLLDPRTYTLDAFALRSTGMSYLRAVGVSIPVAVVGPAVVAYAGLDPFDITPGYGVSPTTNRREWHKHVIDLRSLYM